MIPQPQSRTVVVYKYDHTRVNRLVLPVRCCHSHLLNIVILVRDLILDTPSLTLVQILYLPCGQHLEVSWPLAVVLDDVVKNE